MKTTMQGLLREYRTLGPGPAGYNSYSWLGKSGPSFSIRQKQVEIADNGVPSPNRYYPDVSPIRTAAPSFSVKNKYGSALDVDRQLTEVPSPNHYLISYKAVTKASPAHALASRQDNSNFSTTPAPNQYVTSKAAKLLSRRSESPSFTIKSKETAGYRCSETPGPAAYKTQRPFSAYAPAFSFRAKHSTAKPETLLIGPGSYDVSRKDFGRAALFAGRTYIRYRDEAPGPATYSPVVVPKHSPQFSLAGRHWRPAHSESPGPIYDVYTRSLKDRGATIFARYPAKYEDGVPGVGTYTYPYSFSRPTSAVSLYGMSARFETESNNAPAPCYYKPEQRGVDKRGRIQCSHCYIGYKPKEAKQCVSTPGPGQYVIPGVFTGSKGPRLGVRYTRSEVEAFCLKGTQNGTPRENKNVESKQVK